MPVQEDPSGDASFQRLISAYVKHDTYLCTRLDRPVSGIVVFGQKPSDQTDFQKLTEQNRIQKQYLAIVPRIEETGVVKLSHKLIHDTRNKKAKINSAGNGQIAELEYSLVSQLDHYSLIKIRTYTGRFHQIRAQLAAVNLPIKGDVKYGARRANLDRSIGLHSWCIAFKSNRQIIENFFEAPIPDHDIWKFVKELNIQADRQ